MRNFIGCTASWQRCLRVARLAMLRTMSASAHKQRLLVFGARPSLATGAPGLEDWRQARPAAIARSLDRALARPSGNWYVLAASRDIGGKPSLHVVDGVEMVAWRADGIAHAAPNECPHMG